MVLGQCYHSPNQIVLSVSVYCAFAEPFNIIIILAYYSYPILPLALEEVMGVANSDECYSGDEWSSEGSDDEGSCDPSHDSQLPLLVLPLYSLLAPQQQAKVGLYCKTVMLL